MLLMVWIKYSSDAGTGTRRKRALGNHKLGEAATLGTAELEAGAGVGARPFRETGGG
jgi:hypothetical protein